MLRWMQYGLNQRCPFYLPSYLISSTNYQLDFDIMCLNQQHANFIIQQLVQEKACLTIFLFFIPKTRQPKFRQFIVQKLFIIKIRTNQQMENLKKNNLIYYQQRPHHKQQLRQMIKQQTIDMLEINPNPSDLSRKVYQSLYQDQLERQVAARNSFKEYSYGEPNHLETQNVGINNRNKSVSTIIFKDFHREKDKIVQKHINLNYDGGSSFFKASELHEKMREKQQQQMKVTLNSQLNCKLRQENNKRYIEEIERQRLQGNIWKLKQNSQIERQAKKKQKQNNRNIYMKQMEQERMRKEQSRNWKEGWNRIGRHNPITNPIQYHIENPYILKQIQENKQIKENLKHHKG